MPNLEEVEFLLTEDLYVTPIEDPDGGARYLASDTGRRWACIVRTDDEGQITFNGLFVDIGDYFPQFLGFLDQMAELPVGTETFVPADDCE
jgi:hypothetical protein